MSDSAADVIGYFALIFTVFCYTRYLPRNALLFLSIPAFLWSLHFFCLGEYTGAIVAGLALLRNYLGALLGSREMKYSTAYTTLGGLVIMSYFYAHVTDVLPITAFLLSSLSVYLRDRNFAFRLCSLSAQLVMMLYGVAIGSISLILSCALVAITICVSIFRFDGFYIQRE